MTEYDRALDALNGANALDAMRQAEMQAAVVYWEAWSEVEMQFVRADHDRVPGHWHTFGRRSTQSASGRRAINPHNAILNYLYSLLQGEASLALRAVGLDPGLGVVHLDKYARDSLSLDLMEAARPEVDAYVLNLLDGHRFRAKDFHENRSGGCRISRPLAHALSETAMTWRSHLAQPAEYISRLLFSRQDANVKHLTTPLTQTNRRNAKGASWSPKTATPRISNNCRKCGEQLDSRGKLCSQCWEDFQNTSAWVAIGRERLSRSRDAGFDPAHGGEAARKRGEKNRQRQIAIAEWNASHNRPDDSEFIKEVLPYIQGISLNRLSAVTGLSVDYCSKIRRGLKIPHPRHWRAFRAAIAQSGRL